MPSRRSRLRASIRAPGSMLQIKTTLFAFVFPLVCGRLCAARYGRRGRGFTRDAAHAIIDRLSGLSTDFSGGSGERRFLRERLTGSRARRKDLRSLLGEEKGERNI